MNALTTDRIRSHATRLGLTHLTETITALVERAETAQLGYLEFVDLLLEEEVGLRESRRILADTVLTEQDMQAQRNWEDSIGYGSFFIDIHAIDGPGMDHTVWNPEPYFRYQIPYRILVPLGLENLLTAGRCVSVTHIGLGSLRVMVQCMITGQAAGTAAALSLEQGVSPREVDIGALQASLRAQGCILDEADIAAVNTVHTA